jgi:hypothetical protein
MNIHHFDSLADTLTERRNILDRRFAYVNSARTVTTSRFKIYTLSM